MRILLMLLLVLSLPALAKEAAPAADDPVLERRAMKLASELRCLVCQNQSLADSNADLAIDLKNQVRSQIREGRTDAEIREYMVERYGDFVLYSPPWKPTTVLLWVGPFVLMVAGALALVVYMRNRRGRVVTTELTAEERARAQTLLGRGDRQ
ncbi:MAG TPA: cytochrome c-type biogenesis protein [Burkholderiales bacterium]